MIPSCTSFVKKKTQTQTKCPQHKINYNLIAGRGRTSLPKHKRHRCYQSFPCRLGSRSPWIACFEIGVKKPESWNDCTSQTLLFWQLQWSLALWLYFPSSSFYSRKVSTNETARGDECPPHHFPLSFYLHSTFGQFGWQLIGSHFSFWNILIRASEEDFPPEISPTSVQRIAKPEFYVRTVYDWWKKIWQGCWITWVTDCALYWISFSPRKWTSSLNGFLHTILQHALRVLRSNFSGA